MTALIWVGGLGFAIAIVTDFLRADDTLAGSLAWIGLGVLPIYLVAVWLARRRPDHPQARRLLILATAAAIGELIENALSYWYVGPESDGWLLWVNAVSLINNMLITAMALLLFATYRACPCCWRQWPARRPGVPDDALVLAILNGLFIPFMLAIPGSIVVGVLRYRLYDIDLIVRRSVSTEC